MLEAVDREDMLRLLVLVGTNERLVPAPRGRTTWEQDVAATLVERREAKRRAFILVCFWF